MTSSFSGEPQLNSRFLAELKAVNIPPRPAVLASIEAEMCKDSPDYGALEHLISHDVGIAAGLLKLANSAYYGRSRDLRSIKDALQMLGLRTTAMTIAALSLRKVFANVPNLERFWDSSAQIAHMSGWLCTQLEIGQRWVNSEELYTYALFRDCGIPPLRLMFVDYLEVLDSLNALSDEPFTAAEERLLGLEVNHAAVGAMLAKEWRLPIEFQAAIRHHHDVDAIRGAHSHSIPYLSQYLISIAQLSEYLYQQLTGMAKTSEWGKLGSACLKVLGIDETDAGNLLQSAKATGIVLKPLL